MLKVKLRNHPMRRTEMLWIERDELERERGVEASGNLRSKICLCSAKAPSEPQAYSLC